MKPLRIADILLTLFWAGLLFSWGWMQYQLKQEVQVDIFFFGVATLLLLIFAYGRVASTLYYMLVCVLVYNALFCMFMIPLYGHHAAVTVDGHTHRVMDTSWIFAVLLAIIATPFVLWFYHKKVKRGRTFDIAAIAAFLIITLGIYVHRALLCPQCEYFSF